MLRAPRRRFLEVFFLPQLSRFGSRRASRRHASSTSAGPRVSLAVRIRNSLQHRSTDEQYTTLPPVDQARLLTWYSCGPTVYDSAHIGHARTYICTDIIRRILTDVFGYRIDYAMGLTDVDDKIIARARKERATGKAASSSSSSSSGGGHPNSKLSWAEMSAFARHWEMDFFQDMQKLSVKPPDAVLRVTEHMEEILLYIQRLLDQDQAYITEDGIYFDVSKVADYGKLGGVPPVQEPDQTTATAATAADDWSTAIVGKLGKRGSRDFALWKFAKPGEPQFDPASLSPSLSLRASAAEEGAKHTRIASGRPGWHIECSAMTHSYFGPQLDLHSGGVDLKFPHHTNEIAQCEAHNCTTSHAGEQWVQTWLHTGHIYIAGRKMSKSLKNFISIKEFLSSEEYGSRPATDFRIYCLQHRYSSNLHFGPERIHEATTYRQGLENFCRLVSALGKHRSERAAKPSPESRQLFSLLRISQLAFLEALANDFDTPSALKVVSDLIGTATRYANAATAAASSGAGSHPIECLLAVEQFVMESVGVLGVKIASSGELESGVIVGKSGAKKNAAQKGDTQLVEALVQLRASTRRAGLGGLQVLKAANKRDKSADMDKDDKDKLLGSLKEVVAACDEARVKAAALGIIIDDVGMTTSTWRPSE